MSGANAAKIGGSGKSSKNGGGRVADIVTLLCDIDISGEMLDKIIVFSRKAKSGPVASERDEALLCDDIEANVDLISDLSRIGAGTPDDFKHLARTVMFDARDLFRVSLSPGSPKK